MLNTKMLQDNGNGEYICGPEECGYSGDEYCQNCGYAKDERPKFPVFGEVQKGPERESL